MADSPVRSSDEDTETAAYRHKQAARNPFVPRAAAETLLAAMDRLLEVSKPDPRLPALLTFPKSRAEALLVKRAVEQGLAERDAADRAEPRRRELPERVQTALFSMTECIDGMRALERTKSDIEAAALSDGFLVGADGRVGLGPQHHRRSSAVCGDAARRRARYEHRLNSIMAEMAQLQRDTVATIRERLGADEPGMPWVVVECARGGIDLGGSFDAGARLPTSPLRDLMEQLASDMTLAKAMVSPHLPNNTEGPPNRR